MSRNKSVKRTKCKSISNISAADETPPVQVSNVKVAHVVCSCKLHLLFAHVTIALVVVGVVHFMLLISVGQCTQTLAPSVFSKDIVPVSLFFKMHYKFKFFNFNS